MKNASQLTKTIIKFKIPLFAALILSIFYLISHFFPSTSQPTTTYKKVSISQIINHPALDATQKGIIDGLKQAGFENGKNLILEVAVAQGKVDTSIQIAQKFVGGHSNVIVGISTSSAQTAAIAAKKAGIPVVFSSVTDPLDAKLVNLIDKPGKNVTGVSNYTDIKPQFELFRKLLPNLKRLGIIYNPGEANSVSLMEKSKAIAKEMEIEIVPSPANKTSEVSTAAKKLIGSVDAIYINNDNTALGAFDNIVKIGNQYSVPIFVSDTDMIDQGGLAALGTDQYALGLQTAKMIVRILNGEKADDIPVEFAKSLETKINLKAATKLGVTIPPELLKTAKLVGK